MPTKIEPRLPRGMRDILPKKMILRRYVIHTIEEVFEQFGFEPLQTPALELSETLLGKYGPEAEKLIYDARHREGKEELSLRYDLTVPLSRVVASYPELVKPFKRYQIAPVWRAERPQKGRYREFYQCDADIVGSKSILGDAEIIAVIYTILNRLGFRKFLININSRKILTGIGQQSGVASDQLADLYRAIDKFDKIGRGGVEFEFGRIGLPPPVIESMFKFLRIADEEGSSEQRLERLQLEFNDVKESDTARQPKPNEIGREGIKELKELQSYLKQLGIPDEFLQVNFMMVRGLDYYTGPIYETVVTEPKIGSLTGGGRYDELIGLFTKQSLPATGTTIGIERIIDVMEELGMFPPAVGPTVSQVLVTCFDEARRGASMRMASDLRGAGIKTEIWYELDGLGRQLKYAAAKGIPYAVIVGPDEAASHSATLRDLATGQQVLILREELPQAVRARLDRSSHSLP